MPDEGGDTNDGNEKYYKQIFIEVIKQYKDLSAYGCA